LVKLSSSWFNCCVNCSTVGNANWEFQEQLVPIFTIPAFSIWQQPVAKLKQPLYKVLIPEQIVRKFGGWSKINKRFYNRRKTG
jgi:hypothetical protein